MSRELSTRSVFHNGGSLKRSLILSASRPLRPKAVDVSYDDILESWVLVLVLWIVGSNGGPGYWVVVL